MRIFIDMKANSNKAGYTATSCGRVGRGGNVRFPTFRLDRYGPTDGLTDGPTDGRTKPLIELRVRNLKRISPESQSQTRFDQMLASQQIKK